MGTGGVTVRGYAATFIACCYTAAGRGLKAKIETAGSGFRRVLFMTKEIRP